jgi:hypothetical protein
MNPVFYEEKDCILEGGYERTFFAIAVTRKYGNLE